MTWPPTLGDDLDKVKQPMTDQPQPIRATTEIRAPCCNRKVAADMVVDVRGVDGLDAEWICDACRDRVFRDTDNDWTWSRLMQKLGAPWEDVKREREKEVAWDLRTAAMRRDEEAVDMNKLRRKALRSLPEKPVDLMTKRPAVDALEANMPAEPQNR